jgi:hypothetical protein
MRILILLSALLLIGCSTERRCARAVNRCAAGKTDLHIRSKGCTFACVMTAMSKDKRKGGRRRQFEPLAAVKKPIYVPEGMEDEAIEAARAAIHELWKARKKGKG